MIRTDWPVTIDWFRKLCRATVSVGKKIRDVDGWLVVHGVVVVVVVGKAVGLNSLVMAMLISTAFSKNGMSLIQRREKMVCQ